MGWYYRKSFKFGAARLTFSKSGISYSIGGRGARVTAGPRGTYVTLGQHGVYYRQRIGGPDYQTRVSHPDPRQEPGDPVEPFLHTITSNPIDELTDCDSKAFVDELNLKAKRISYLRVFCLAPAFLSAFLFLCYFSQTSRTEEETSYFVSIESASDVNVRHTPDKDGAIIGLAAMNHEYRLLDSTGPSWSKIAFGDTVGYISKRFARLDSSKSVVRTFTRFETDTRDLVSVTIIGIGFFIFLGIVFYKQDKTRLLVEIHYEFDDQIRVVYDKFLDCFKEFLNSDRVWQYLHSEQTADYKHHAGAGNLINRIPVKRVSPDQKPARFFRTNINVPNIKLRNTDLYFFPERLIIKREGQFAAVFYRHLSIASHPCIFIEDSGVSADAQIVGHTWRFLNKDGSPDRRFNNNRQIPKCQYSQYQFLSATGVNEIITTSKLGAFDNFAHILRAIGKFQEAFPG